MRKLLDFGTYQKIKNLSFNDFNRWAVSLYKSGYVDALEDNCNSESGEEAVSEITDERLLEILLSVKGIGKARAEQAIEKILKEGKSQ